MMNIHTRTAPLALWLVLLLPSGVAAQSSGTQLYSDPDPEGVGVGLPSLAPLGATLMPAVVSILVSQEVDPKMLDPMLEFFQDFFGGDAPEKFENTGVGSGVIVNADGYIVTNHHVVQDATSIIVSLHDGEEYEAEVVGTDPDTDVALIKIEVDGLPTVPLGDSDELEVGDWVIAVGTPFGLSATMTAGIVSAKGRHQVGPYKDHKYQDFIQTDAPINPGSSGGPLFDLGGNVVGINTAINAAGQGIGFAIPINMVKPIIPQLYEHGTVLRSWLGVNIQMMTAPLAQAFGLPGQPRGALVSDVLDGSPAHQAGIRVGDIILEFDGESIESVDELSWLAATKGQGAKVKVKIFRKGKKKTLKVNLASMPGSPQPSAPKKIKIKKKQPKDLQVTFSEVDAPTAQKLEIQQVDGTYPGAVVTWIQPGSPLHQVGLDKGDVILTVNHKQVFAPQEVKKVLASAKNGEVVLLYVSTGKQKGFLTYSP